MSTKAEIKAVMDQWNKAIADGNLKELAGLLCDDKATICYDTGGNKHVGYNRVLKAFEDGFKTMRIHLTSEDLTINTSGNMAWVADDQHAKITDLKGRVLLDTPLKWTSVLQKRKGKWVIVQIHHSIPAST